MDWIVEYLADYKFSAKISQRLIGLRLKMADRQGAGCWFLVAGYWLPTYALLRRAPTYVKTSVDRSVGKLVAGCRLLGAGYWLLPARQSLFFSVGEPARRSLLYSVGEVAGCLLLVAGYWLLVACCCLLAGACFIA